MPHLTDSEIVRAIEGNLGEQDKARVLEHLHTCSRCFDAYQDSALMLGIWQTNGASFPPDEGLVELGVQVASGGTARTGEAGSRLRLRSAVLRLAVAATFAVVLVAALWWLSDRTRETAFDTVVIAPIRAAVETASRWGPFIFPGGERSLDADGPAFRSGFIALSDSLEASLGSLQAAFQAGKASPDVITWLVSGLVVTGQIDAARDVASHPRTADITGPTLTILRAIVAHIDGDYDTSERLLRGVLDEYPDDPTASIDLAIVLGRQGNEAEARAILTRVRQVHAGTPVGRRAQSLLSDM